MSRFCQPKITVLIIFTLLLGPAISHAETVARCGQGWLERIDGVMVLHVKGSPYEMGYQHGALLREDCQENFNYLLGEKAREKIGGLIIRVRRKKGVCRDPKGIRPRGDQVDHQGQR